MSDLRSVVANAESILLGRGSFAHDLLAGCGEVKQTGRDQYETTCPGCGSHNLSYTTNKTNFARCWKCGLSLGWYTAAVKFGKAGDYLEYARLVCELAGVPLELDPETERAYAAEARRGDVIEAVLGWARKRIWEAEGAAVLDYLHDRGYADDEIRSMSLGSLDSATALVADMQRGGITQEELRGAGALTTSGEYSFGKTHVLAVPWRDAIGRPVGMSCRAITPTDRKYLHSAGLKVGEHLFNLHAVHGEQLVAVCEGPIDALLMSHHGIPAVACGGTALSRYGLDTLRAVGCEALVVAMDSDGAGRNATRRILIDAQKAGITSHVALLPLKDPDEVIRSEGADAMRECVQRAISAAAWLGADMLTGVDMQLPTQRDPALARCAKVYSAYSQSDPIAAADFADAVAEASGLDQRAVRTRLSGPAANLDEVTKLRGHVKSIAEVIGAHAEQALKQLHDPLARVPALSLGLGDRLDDALGGGLLDGDLVGWGGRSGSGKSRTLIYSMCKAAASGKRVGVISLDMRSNRFAAYAGSSIAAITRNVDALTPKYLLQPDRSNIELAEGRLLAFTKCGEDFRGSLFAVTEGAKNIAAMRIYADMMFDELGVDALVIDGIYSLDEWHTAVDKGQGAQYAVVQVFKLLAENKRRPVVAVSQITRGSYERPTVGGLDWGKALEQLADSVILIHDAQRALCEKRNDLGGITGYVVDRETGDIRPPRMKGGIVDSADAPYMKTAVENPRDVEFIIGKNRGETGMFVVNFDFIHGCKYGADGYALHQTGAAA